MDILAKVKGEVKATIEKRPMVTYMAIAFVGLCASMVVNAFVADHIKKSTCDMAANPGLQRAYKWSWMAAALDGVLAVASVGAIAYVWTRK